MSNRGGSRTYRGGPKDHWRRWGWNRTLERTRGREKESPIPYLAGPEDNDRRIATSKGVPALNLIAIDEIQRNVNRVRRDGGVAICADVGDLLIAWPSTCPCAAVVLDFCGGLQPDPTVRLFNALLHPAFVGATVWINMLRGRDPQSNFLREALAKFKWPELLDEDGDLTKNRARQFFMLMVFGMLTVARIEHGRLWAAERLNDFGARLMTGYSPLFYSYASRSEKGAVNVYDSVIFQACPDGFEPARRVKQPLVAPDDYQRSLEPTRDAQNLIRAALAVRTMRADR